MDDRDKNSEFQWMYQTHVKNTRGGCRNIYLFYALSYWQYLFGQCSHGP